MTRLRALLTVIACGAAVVAASPHTLSPIGRSTPSVAADIAPWIGIVIAWELLALRSAGSAELRWALPSHVFRAAIVVGGALTLLTRAMLLVAPPVTMSAAAVAATTLEDAIYGLGIVALGGLAGFATTRTMLRSTLRFEPPPASASDVSLRTRFVLIAAATSFATAGVLLDVLVDFARTPDDVLLAYVLLSGGLVAFATLIGWLLGDDAARGVSAIARRLRDAAGDGSTEDGRPPLLAADEIAELAAAAVEIERRVRREAVHAAASSERDRIGRELHDGVAKSVSILALEAATAGRADGDVRPALARIERLARLLSEELRAIVTDVRARDERPFSAALRELVDRHPPAVLATEGDMERIDALARFEVLRIVDEALANARRHARAERIAVHVTACDDEVRVEVDDDGAGAPTLGWDELARTGRYGLVGIRERAGLLNGALSIGASPLGGTRVAVVFPVTR